MLNVDGFALFPDGEHQRPTVGEPSLSFQGNHPSSAVEIHDSIDWFKGKITGKSHDLHGKIYGFRLRFSLQLIH